VKSNFLSVIPFAILVIALAACDDSQTGNSASTLRVQALPYNKTPKGWDDIEADALPLNSVERKALICYVLSECNLNTEKIGLRHLTDGDRKNFTWTLKVVSIVQLRIAMLAEAVG
jgi:hypothetical protein